MFARFESLSELDMTVRELLISMVVIMSFFGIFAFFANRNKRKSRSKRQPPVNPPKFDNYSGKNPPSTKEAVHEYVLTTVDQAALEFRYECKFSVDDVYYKLGKRYPRDLIRQALCQLANTGKLEAVWSRKGHCCFIKVKSR